MKKVLMMCAVGLMLTVTACATTQNASDVIDEAVAAMNDTGNASECATLTYEQAKKALAEAQEAAAAGDQETARAKARLAQTLAKQAKEEAELNAEDCAKRLEQQTEIAQRLDQNVVSDVDDVVVSDVAFEVVYFDFDEAQLSSAAVEAIMKNIAILRQKPTMSIQLAAHTDERGTTEYNLALSQKRGETVKNYVTTMGIDEARLVVVPYGKEKPVAFGSREQDYALNRRVEFIGR